jgi:uncharacterized protein
MQLLLDSRSGILLVRSYAVGQVIIGDQVLTAPCVVAPRQLITHWVVGRPAELELTQLEPLLALKPNVLVLGTGAQLERPPLALRRQLEARSVAIEVMDLGAACRLYNVLAGEGRQVVAGLFPV